MATSAKFICYQVTGPQKSHLSPFLWWKHNIRHIVSFLTPICNPLHKYRYIIQICSVCSSEIDCRALWHCYISIICQSILHLLSAFKSLTHLPGTPQRISNHSANSSSICLLQKTCLAESCFHHFLQVSQTPTDFSSLKATWHEARIQSRSNRTRKSYWPKCNFSLSFPCPISPWWHRVPCKHSTTGRGILAREGERQGREMAQLELSKHPISHLPFLSLSMTSKPLKQQEKWSSAVIYRGNTISILKLFY